jgi:hypothetical protein
VLTLLTTFARGASPVLWTGLAFFLLVLLPGCYSYAPILGEPPSPGEEVRLRLSGATAAELSERVGRPIRSVEGTVVRVERDSLAVDVGWGAIYAGTVFEGRRDTLTFHEDQILEADRKEFSRLRTGALGVGAALVVIAVIRSLSAGGDVPPPDNGGPPPF